MNALKILSIFLFILIHCENFSQSLAYQPAFNTELLSHIKFGENSAACWGMEKNGIQYAIIGNRNKVSIFSLEDPKNPKLRYEAPGVPSSWREIKSYNNHLYIAVDEGADGVMIIDMTLAPEKFSHAQFKPLLSVGADVNKELMRCHNIYIDEKGFMYLSGCNISNKGVLFFDLKENPKNPVYKGNVDLQYSHDVFVRGDTMYNSEILVGKLAIYDVKDKSKPELRTSITTSRAFTHNGWPSDNNKYVFTTDERQNAYVESYDISDLNNIKLLDKYRTLERENDGVIPHNTHFYNGYLVTSYYTDGIRIIDANRPENLVEVAYYDTWEDQNVCHNNFFGCWGVFPYTGSDIIYGSDINNGLFILKVKYQRACYLEGKITDTNGVGISNAQVQIVSDQVNRKSTDPAGEYKTGQVLSGTFKVKITHPEYLGKEATVNLKNGEITSLNVILEKRIPISLNINIIDKTGMNLACNVFFQGETTNTLVQTNVNPDFKVTLSSGTYNVFVTKWGYKNVFIPVLNVSNSFSAIINATVEKAYEDNFQTNLNWTVVNSSGVQGAWVRAIPRGILSGEGFITNPASDSDDRGNMAWVTGNGIPGANCNDVDNGTTELQSPLFDLTSYTQPALNFDAWFYAGNGSTPPDDTLVIKLSNGQTEIIVDKIFNSTLGWKKVRNIEIKKLLPLTSNMQLKISASDQTGNKAHIIEAGFDNFFISELTPSSSADFNFADDRMKIYPNPSKGMFTINTETPFLRSSYIINDMLGRVVQSGILADELTEINTFGWKPGIYFLKAENHKVLKIVCQD